MAFRGWTAEALDFYEGLAADNSKTYWTAHKAFYDEKVRGPMVELLAELEPEFGTSRILRPNRDVRFSTDKSPYKMEIAAILEADGYIQLSATGLGVGSGMWMMAPDQLARYREAVAHDRKGGELEKIVGKLKSNDIEVGGQDTLKTVPKGYPRDHPRAEMLRHKGLAAFKQWPIAAWLGTAAAKKRVVDFLRATRPLHDWQDKYVGDAAMTASHR
ncbi:MAG TPA: TIGR02453 family protein [Micromonosporaceae bacterium]|nr:TIGR02453 family protein [Micromonosporaceae bacterium]HCU49723.1 TIGR02453 family protein [Micromonosporaceae bacterium]